MSIKYVWNDERLNLLVAKWEQRPMLYEVGINSYKKMTSKKKMCEEIGKEMSPPTSGDEINKKIKYLRTRFLTIKKKEEQMENMNRTIKVFTDHNKVWPLYSSLQFLQTPCPIDNGSLNVIHELTATPEVVSEVEITMEEDDTDAVSGVPNDPGSGSVIQNPEGNLEPSSVAVPNPPVIVHVSVDNSAVPSERVLHDIVDNAIPDDDVKLASGQLPPTSLAAVGPTARSAAEPDIKYTILKRSTVPQTAVYTRTARAQPGPPKKRKKKATMPVIQTYVVIDLETTGLPSYGSKTRITEIAMHSTSRESIISAARDKNLLPRVANKMLFCVNPGKKIDPFAANMTGLNNQNLKNVNGFDKELCQLINLYLKRLPQPVCLVAHNGSGFDFPILKSELREIGESLPEDVLCVDSLCVFRELHKKGCPKPLGLAMNRRTTNMLFNHKLGDLYKFLVTSDAEMNNAHSADGDVEALLKCMVVDGDNFLESAEKKAKKFAEVNCMW